MDKSEYINEFFKEMKSYILDKKTYVLLIEQGLDVINSFENNHEKNIGSPNELTEELFELNDITLPLKKEKRNYKMFNTIRILFGLLLILIGINVLLDLSILTTIICILMLILIIMFYMKKHILSGTLLLLIFLVYSGIYRNILVIPIKMIIMLLLVYIGIKILLFPKRHYAHIHAKAKKHQIDNFEKYQTNNVKVANGKEVQKGSLSIENSFSDTKTYLKDQQVNLILIDNRFGNLDLDFTTFKFPRKDITLDIENNFGTVTIIKNKNIKISTQVDSLAGNLNTKDGYYESVEDAKMIYIIGKNRFGELKVKNQ